MYFSIETATATQPKSQQKTYHFLFCLGHGTKCGWRFCELFWKRWCMCVVLQQRQQQQHNEPMHCHQFNKIRCEQNVRLFSLNEEEKPTNKLKTKDFDSDSCDDFLPFIIYTTSPVFVFFFEGIPLNYNFRFIFVRLFIRSLRFFFHNFFVLPVNRFLSHWASLCNLWYWKLLNGSQMVNAIESICSIIFKRNLILQNFTYSPLFLNLVIQCSFWLFHIFFNWMHMYKTSVFPL